MALSINTLLKQIDKHTAHMPRYGDLNELYEPRDYIMGLGGKKLRSLLCALAYSIYKPDIEKSFDLAYAIELFHNFTLVHDDIMDDANLRRTKPTVHVKYNKAKALLTGDVMLIEVYDRILKLDMVNKLEFLSLFTSIARAVCEGQSMDMSFESRDDVSMQEYLRMIELKTAVLLGFSLQAGALLAGASQNESKHLYHFATNVGISFQLQDDYLDVYGDPNTFGKKIGGDIIQGKKTYLYIKAIELLDEVSRKEFEAVYNGTKLKDAEKIIFVKSVFDELYLTNYCQESKQAYMDLALSHLDELNVEPDDRELLREFGFNLMNRSL